jgi:CPA1 family monovalent cation:H+ antiporter
LEFLITNTIGLLVVAIGVALAARRLRLPYTVGLVVTGIGLTVTHLGAHESLTHDFIYDVVLPPLLFEAAINLHWKELKQDAAPILTLALAGTLVAAGVTTAGMVLGLGWPLPSALMFGVLIAATDPVAVIAMFKDNGIKGRLRLLVESESLLNDGAAAVLFAVASVFVSNGVVDGLTVSKVLSLTVAGGIIVGLIVGSGAIAIAGRSSDHLIEGTVTTVAAYGSFLLAERFHCSGVLATVTAGLVVGNRGLYGGERALIKSRDFVLGLWDFAAFIVNSLVFLLIGLTVAGIPFGTLGLPTLAAVIALTLVARAVTVYPLCLFFARTPRAVTVRQQHILWWGGLRGALGLALALALPPTLPYRDEILVATFGVVVFSVVVQGLSMPFLLRLLGFGRHPG